MLENDMNKIDSNTYEHPDLIWKTLSKSKEKKPQASASKYFNILGTLQIIGDLQYLLCISGGLQRVFIIVET
jgi:hypothetical protein